MDTQTIKAASAGGNILRFPDPAQKATQKATIADQQGDNFKRVLAAGDTFLGSHHQAGLDSFAGSASKASNPEDNIYRTNRYRVALDDPLLYVMPGQNSGADGATSTSWHQPNVLSQQANDLYARADLEKQNQHRVVPQHSAAANSLFKGSRQGLAYESALEGLKINHNAEAQEASPELDLFLQRFALYNQRQQGQKQVQEQGQATAAASLAQAPQQQAPLVSQALAQTQTHAQAQQAQRAESAPLAGQLLANQLRALQPQTQTPAPASTPALAQESAQESSQESANQLGGRSDVASVASDATALAKEPQSTAQAPQVQAGSPFSNSPNNAGPNQGINKGISLWARSDIPRYTGLTPAQPTPSIEGRIVRG